ncbi:hypothetical protein ABZ712_23540 [Streptomyces sp. NPDC006906]|uniref:hypothetical protein n=1 Tax=Streptomyces sp. NPDC006906 TaxID=3154782 RepID=UPI0033F8BCB3
MISGGNRGLWLAWATEFNFDELKDMIADLSSQHAAPPASLAVIPFRSASIQNTMTDATELRGADLMDRVSSVAIILSPQKARGADIAELVRLTTERHISIEVFYPVDAQKSTVKFATRLARDAKGGCVYQEFKSHELSIFLKSWIERQVAHASSSAERIAQSYTGKHWMDAFGGFQ